METCSNFSSGSEEQGNQFKSSVFKYADPVKSGRSLLEGNKNHLHSQARSELMKQEHQVESLNNCISELQQQAFAQRLELQDAQHGYIESRREQLRLQEEISLKEKALRETLIRNIHEMGEMKRAQELRVDDFSVQKLRGSHETIQRLTSQMQEMQEQMNSGKFQEVESNHSGRLSYVPSQPAAISSSCSMRSRDKRLPLDTWNTSGLQGNVFGIQFSTLDSSRNHYQRIHHSTTPGDTGSVPVHMGIRTLVARDEDQNLAQNCNADICKKASDREFIISGAPSTLFVWKIRFKNQVTTCSDFPSEAMLWIKDVEMVDSLVEF